MSRRTEKRRQPDTSDLDAATIRSLLLMTGGSPKDFADYESPPDDIKTWLAGANLGEVFGLLVHTVRRWHELRAATEPSK